MFRRRSVARLCQRLWSYRHRRYPVSPDSQDEHLSISPQARSILLFTFQSCKLCFAEYATGRNAKALFTQLIGNARLAKCRILNCHLTHIPTHVDQLGLPGKITQCASTVWLAWRGFRHNKFHILRSWPYRPF